jgi:hypothetical protein
MDGYAVYAPVQRVRRERGVPADAGSGGRIAPAPDPLETIAAERVVAIDLSGRSIGDRLSDRLEAIRTTVAQTTFFLFDAESWR